MSEELSGAPGAAPPSPQRPDVPDPEVVAAAVEALPSVAGMASESLGVEVATYLPGHRVRGVRVHDGVVEVHVVARYGASLLDVAEEVRDTVAPLVGGAQVAVFFEDLEVPGLDEPTAPVAELPPAES